MALKRDLEGKREERKKAYQRQQQSQKGTVYLLKTGTYCTPTRCEGGRTAAILLKRKLRWVQETRSLCPTKALVKEAEGDFCLKLQV